MDEEGHCCENCRFWSELLARKWMTNLQAVCLNKKSASYRLYRPGSHHCANWAENTHGAVDLPELPHKAYTTKKNGL